MITSEQLSTALFITSVNWITYTGLSSDISMIKSWAVITGFSVSLVSNVTFAFAWLPLISIIVTSIIFDVILQSKLGKMKLTSKTSQLSWTLFLIMVSTSSALFPFHWTIRFSSIIVGAIASFTITFWVCVDLFPLPSS